MKYSIEWVSGVVARVWIACFGTRRGVVLAYHAIQDHPWIHALSPDMFRAHLVWLAKHTNIVPLAELESSVHENSVVHARPFVAITFDDGYAEWVSHALPMLAAVPARATFFITTSFQPVMSVPQEGIEMLHPEDVQILSRAGHEIGSHSATHADLSEIPADQLQDELVSSKKKLEELSGTRVTRMSYPKGRFNVSRRSEMKDAGYVSGYAGHGAVTAGQDVYFLPRVPVHRDVPVWRLAARIYCALAWG